MKERSILFSELMVEAILEGRKTVTRRIVKYIPDLGEPPLWCHRAEPDDSDLQKIIGDYRRYCPYGQPGDQLWVRESWAHDAENLESARSQHEDAMSPSPVYYWATLPDFERGSLRKRPSIHMPRWASRISLEITDVKVERLQDITPNQAKAEGDKERSGFLEFHERGPLCHVDWFRNLWNGINGERAHWDTNPWVWVVSFERVVTQ